MQISRLFKIVYMLQDKKRLTAQELASHFEVSPRTIMRDIDALSEAGIPVYTVKGKGGGISIMDHFVLNKTTISKEEQDHILFALQSLTMMEDMEERELLTKLQAFFQNTRSGWIEVDFTKWGTDSSGRREFALLKEAILRRRVLSFVYTPIMGETLQRTINPLRLVFKGNSWYLQGYCRLKEDYRIFKIQRMFQIELLEEEFEPEDYELPPFEVQSGEPAETTLLKLWFAKEYAYRAYDDFRIDEISRNADGSVLVEADIVFDPGIYDYFLSLGKGIKILEPAFAREQLMQLIEDIKTNYENMT